MRKTSCIVKVPDKGLTFSESQVRSVNILEEVDPLSINLSSNKATISLYHPDGDLDLLLEDNVFGLVQNDKIEIYEKIDGKQQFLGTFYYDIATSADETQITIECLDAINLLGKTTFYWGEYYNEIDGKNVKTTSRKTVQEVAHDILDDAGVSFSIDDDLKDLPVYGHLPILTHRLALQYLAFSVGATVSCARSDKINITKMQDKTKYVIEKAQKFESSADLTDYVNSIAVKAHDLSTSTSLTGVQSLTWTRGLGNGQEPICYTGNKLWTFGALVCQQPIKDIQTDDDGNYRAQIRWDYDPENGGFITDRAPGSDRTDRYVYDVKQNKYLVNATVLNLNYPRNLYKLSWESCFAYFGEDETNDKKFSSYSGVINAFKLIDTQNIIIVGDENSETRAEINDCTLITSENAEEVGNRCLEYYQKRKKITFKFVLNDEKVGYTYIIWVRNRYYLGTITSLSIDCTGGFLATATAVCSTESKLSEGNSFITSDGKYFKSNQRNQIRTVKGEE